MRERPRRWRQESGLGGKNAGGVLREQVATEILLRIEPNRDLIHDMGVRNVTFLYFYHSGKPP